MSQTPSPALGASALPVPRYLERVYWWAYIHPRAVQIFERDWLVNAILFGNYGRLRDAAVVALATESGTVEGRTLQVACAYGNLTDRLYQGLAPQASLDVIDVLPVQLANLAAKLPADPRIGLMQADSTRLDAPDEHYDQVLLFFLLHEQPETVRRATLAEALRVLRPGGRLVMVDYHCPATWHPLRPLMRLVFARLEPYAMDLWRQPLGHFLPAGATPTTVLHTTFFGGLYQLLELTK